MPTLKYRHKSLFTGPEAAGGGGEAMASVPPSEAPTLEQGLEGLTAAAAADAAAAAAAAGNPEEAAAQHSPLPPLPLPSLSSLLSPSSVGGGSGGGGGTAGRTHQQPPSADVLLGLTGGAAGGRPKKAVRGGGAATLAGRGRRSDEVRFDRTLSYELLKQCAVASMLDKGLAECVVLHPVVARAVTFQCVYACNVLRGVKYRMTQALSVPVGGVAQAAKPAGYLQAFASGTWPNFAVALPSQLTVGIIGCGAIGAQVLEAVLSSKLYHVTCLVVSTRQPCSLPAYTQAGVRVCFDNAAAAEAADVLILACQPCQLPDVASHIRGRVRPSAVVFSTLLGVSAGRLATVLGHPHCATTDVEVATLASLAHKSSKAAEANAAGVKPGMPELPLLLEASCLFPRRSLTKTEAWVGTVLGSLAQTPANAPVALGAILCSMTHEQLAPALMKQAFAPLATRGGGEVTLARWGGLAAFDEHLPVSLVEHISDYFAEVCSCRGP